VHAFVVLREGASVDPEVLRDHCRQFIAGYKIPKTITYVSQLPRNASGKVLKRELREEWSPLQRT
jgi:long-chain acyl-CoA synthetase